MKDQSSPAERRFGLRRGTDVKVFAHNGVELRKCRLRDISLQGAFIETKNFPLAEGTTVELVIRIRRDGKHLHCRFPARVRRAQPDGAALIFTEVDKHLRQVLTDIVYAGQGVGEHRI